MRSFFRPQLLTISPGNSYHHRRSIGLTSISTVLRRANAEAFMSVACQEKAILRRLPPNHGMGVGSSARLEATR